MVLSFDVNLEDQQKGMRLGFYVIYFNNYRETKIEQYINYVPILFDGKRRIRQGQRNDLWSFLSNKICKSIS